MSPRKRKRSDDESIALSDTESWVETEDEVPDLIAEGMQTLIETRIADVQTTSIL